MHMKLRLTFDQVLKLGFVTDTPTSTVSLEPAYNNGATTFLKLVKRFGTDTIYAFDPEQLATLRQHYVDQINALNDLLHIVEGFDVDTNLELGTSDDVQG